jgi:hypothetical protein
VTPDPPDEADLLELLPDPDPGDDRAWADPDDYEWTS